LASRVTARSAAARTRGTGSSRSAATTGNQTGVGVVTGDQAGTSLDHRAPAAPGALRFDLLLRG